MKIFTKWLTITLVSLFFVLATTLAVLLYTETGTGWVFGQLQKQQIIAYQGLQGSLQGGLEFERLQVNLPDTEIVGHQLQVRAAVFKLLFNQLRIEQLSVQRLEITLTGESESTINPAEIDLSFLDSKKPLLPLDVILDDVLRINQLVITSTGKPVVIDNIAVNLFANERGVQLRQLSLAYQEWKVEGSGRYLVWPKLNISAHLDVVTEQEELTLKATTSAKADNDELSLSLKTHDNLDSQLNINLNHWLKPQREIELQGDIVKADITFKEAQQLRLADSSLNVQGNLSRLTINAEGSGQYNLYQIKAFLINALLKDQRLTVSEAKLQQQEGQIAFQGEVAWADILSWQGELNLEQFDTSTFHSNLPRNVYANLLLSGSYGDNLNLIIDRGWLQGDLQGDRVQATFKGALQGRQGIIEELQVTAGENRLSLSGEVNQQTLDINLSANLKNPGVLIPGLYGQLTLQGKVFGALKKPNADITGQGQTLRWRDMHVEQFELATNMLDGKLLPGRNSIQGKNLQLGALDITQLNLKASGDWLSPDLSLAAEITNPYTAHSLTASQNESLRINSSMNLQLSEPTIKLTFRETQLASEATGTWRQSKPSELSLLQGAWQLSESCLLQHLEETSKGGSLCGEVSQDANGFKVRLDAQKLPLELLSMTGLSPLPIKGAIDLKANIAESGKLLSGEVTLQPSGKAAIYISPTNFLGSMGSSGQTGADQYLALNELSVDTFFKDAKVQGSLAARVDGAGNIQGDFEISQPLTDNSQLNAGLSYQITDLSAYQQFLPMLENLGGDLNGIIRVTHALGDPEFTTSTQINIPQIYLNNLGVEWQNIIANIDTDGEGNNQISLDLDAGDGKLSGLGFVAIKKDRGLQAKLEIQGNNALLMDLPERRIIANPDLTVELQDNQTSLTGKLVIPSAALKVVIPDSTQLSLTSDAVIHEYADIGETKDGLHTKINLRLVLGDDVHLKAYGLKSRLEGRLQLTQQNGNGVLAQGDLSLVEGAYRAYGQDLTITRGNILFSGLVDKPSLNLTASREVREVTAGLHVTGPVDNLATRLFSSPPMTDSEILSYILRGKPLSETSTTDRHTVSNAALGYAISQTKPITDKLSDLTGLDDIIIESEEGLESVGLALGKYLTPDLYVRYGMDVVDRISKVLVRYQLTDRLFLETEASKGQSIDLIYRVE